MSMLAGPRRKQRVINLRAKNNEWSKDKNKFGQRMLEKMGWSEGKGLGANENGIVEHVIARYKNDEKGLGFADRNDQWTKHEDDFNALLANLSNSSDQNQSQEVLHSGKSLETKSKKSKARIHYHKFTRGKDLARYSEKDLANIFGKRSLKPNENEEPAAKEEDDTEKVFTEKGSMYDYFKNKMAGMNNVGAKFSELNKDNDEDILDHSFQGFSNSNSSPQESEKESKGFNKSTMFSFYPQMSESISINENDVNSSGDKELSEKSKKKKKSKQQEIIETLNNHDLPEENDSHQKKKKSKKSSQEELVEQEEQAVKKKKKKDKVPVENVDESTEIIYKKKKKKNKEIDL